MTSTITYTILCTVSATISLQWAMWPLLTNWHDARPPVRRVPASGATVLLDVTEPIPANTWLEVKVTR